MSSKYSLWIIKEIINLVDIEKMFTDSSTFSFQNTGVLLGRKEIMKMINVFFNSFNFKIGF